jgi:DNA-binding NtrC family response regulator
MARGRGRGEGDAPEGTERMASAGSAPALLIQRVKLTVIEGPDAGRALTLEQDPVSVGSLPESSLPLTDRTVSRRHALILRQPAGYLLRDLGSTNGTSVNGVPVKEAFLPEGALLAFGGTRVRFSLEAERVEVRPSAATRFGELLGESARMREVFGILERVAPTGVTVLIRGETGTGKELVARALHAGSSRRGGPLVVFDCGAVPPNLMESELFGHERGAFTGATAPRTGALEQAHGGTLFLDEVGELSPELQPKLLRVLETREVKRVGGNRMARVDIRLVAATHRDLPAEVRSGRFREDLYFRLAVVSLELPPLRDRPGDIPLLADHFLRTLGAELGLGPPPPLSPEALARLRTHSWPGNVRELRNALQAALAMGGGRPITPAELVFPGAPASPPPPASGASSLADVERATIAETLRATGGNRKQAARVLGIAVSTLHEKIKRYGITD